jgi:hypothetical protein
MFLKTLLKRKNKRVLGVVIVIFVISFIFIFW